MTDQEILLIVSALIYISGITISFLYKVKRWKLPTKNTFPPEKLLYLIATGLFITSFFFK